MIFCFFFLFCWTQEIAASYAEHFTGTGKIGEKIPKWQKKCWIRYVVWYSIKLLLLCPYRKQSRYLQYYNNSSNFNKDTRSLRDRLFFAIFMLGIFVQFSNLLTARSKLVEQGSAWVNLHNRDALLFRVKKSRKSLLYEVICYTVAYEALTMV